MSSSVVVTEKRKNNPDSLILKGTLLVSSTFTVLAGAAIAPALPALTEAFADTPNVDFLVRFVLTLPALFIALGAPLAGFIVDKFGRKPLLIISAVVYGFAGGSGYFVDQIWALLIGRALLGIAVAGVMTTVTTLIADYYQRKERSSFLGIQAAFSGMGGVVFLSLGGFLADLGWRTPFLIYMLSFLVLPFMITSLYEPALSKQDGQQKSTPTNVTLPVGLLAFAYSAMLLTQIVFYAVPVQLPFYLGDLVGATGSQSGMAIAGLSLFFSIASASYGWFDRQLNHLYTMLLGFTLTGIGFILLTLAGDWLLIAIGLPVSGFGLGLVVPNIITWIAEGVSETVRGRALGGVTTSLFLGQFLSPFFVTPLSNQTGEGGVYAALGVFLLISVVVAFFLRGAINNLTHINLEE